MRVASVENYSDRTNSAVVRHPDRRFPGLLVQGDNLYAMCQLADAMCQEIGRGSPGYASANDLRNRLWSYLTHYKTTLIGHEMPLPFNEQPIGPWSPAPWPQDR